MSISHDHILTQVEWFHKLHSQYRCNLVRMEYRFHKYRIDVFGRTQGGTCYLVEVGGVKPDKLSWLNNYIKQNPHHTLLHVKTTHTRKPIVWNYQTQKFKSKSPKRVSFQKWQMSKR